MHLHLSSIESRVTAAAEQAKVAEAVLSAVSARTLLPSAVHGCLELQPQHALRLHAQAPWPAKSAATGTCNQPQAGQQMVLCMQLVLPERPRTPDAPQSPHSPKPALRLAGLAARAAKTVRMAVPGQEVRCSLYACLLAARPAASAQSIEAALCTCLQSTGAAPAESSSASAHS